MARKISERLSTADVAKYEATRYKGDQKLINQREQRIVRELLAVAAAGRGDLVALDVPSGFGRFSPAILESVRNLVSFDRSETMASRARERSRALGAAAFASGVCDIRSLPFADRSFDVVLSMRLLHHLHSAADRQAMFAELFRVCRGHLVISFYDRTPIHRAQRAMTALVKPKRRKSPLFFFGMRQFRAEAAAAGFEVLAVKAPIRGLHAQRVALLFAKPRVARRPESIEGELALAESAIEAKELDRAIWHLLAAREHGASGVLVDDRLWQVCRLRAALEEEPARKREAYMRYKTFCPRGKHLEELRKIELAEEEEEA